MIEISSDEEDTREFIEILSTDEEDSNGASLSKRKADHLETDHQAKRYKQLHVFSSSSGDMGTVVG